MFFFFNAIFALILIIMLIVSSVFAIVYKNPDTRYQPMRDDRGSFIKSQSNLNTELDALGATARGDMKMKRDLDEDSDSISSAHNSFGRQQHDAQGLPLPQSATGSSANVAYGQPPRSPVDPSTPFIPAGGSRHGSPGYGNGRDPYGRAANASPAPRYNAGYGNSPATYGGGGNNYDYGRSQSINSNTSYRPYNGGGGGAAGSQWQRGAGYDH